MKISRPTLLVLASLLTGRSAGISAQGAPQSIIDASPAGSSSIGLLVVAHGADAGWNALVDQTVAGVQWRRGPMAVAYLMGAEAAKRSWDVAVQQLVAKGATSIVVVPLMVSTHGEHVTQIRYYAGELTELPASLAMSEHGHGDHRPSPVPMLVTGAIDGAAELGTILLDRWRALAPAVRGRTLMLVAHGPSADSLAGEWLRGVAAAAAPLVQELGERNVRIGLLRDDAAPPVRASAIGALRDSIAALARRSGDSVTVMTVLVSSGDINRVRVPADLNAMPMRYVGAALAPHPALARWIERVALSAVERLPAPTRDPIRVQ